MAASIRRSSRSKCLISVEAFETSSRSISSPVSSLSWRMYPIVVPGRMFSAPESCSSSPAMRRRMVVFPGSVRPDERNLLIVSDGKGDLVQNLESPERFSYTAERDKRHESNP